jgi:hypothetical protein
MPVVALQAEAAGPGLSHPLGDASPVLVAGCEGEHVHPRIHASDSVVVTSRPVRGCRDVALRDAGVPPSALPGLGTDTETSAPPSGTPPAGGPARSVAPHATSGADRLVTIGIARI